MKETFYFSHDYNARNDEKILKLIKKEDWFGYGLYWAIIEKLYESGGFLEKDYDCIAFDLRTQCERIQAVVESGLFQFSKDKFFSNSVLARLRARKGKSEKARQSAILRWNKPKKEDANAMRTQCDGNAIKESKVKESKVKEIDIADKSAETINNLLNEFQAINPTINYGNITQRKCLEELIKKWGYEKTLNTIKAAVKIQGQKFAPTITTPLQLKNKMGELLIFYKKESGTQLRSI